MGELPSGNTLGIKAHSQLNAVLAGQRPHIHSAKALAQATEGYEDEQEDQSKGCTDDDPASARVSRLSSSGIASDCLAEYDISSPRDFQLSITEKPLDGRDSAFGTSDRQLRKALEDHA